MLINHIISHLANTDFSTDVTAVPTTSSRRQHTSKHYDFLSVAGNTSFTLSHSESQRDPSPEHSRVYTSVVRMLSSSRLKRKLQLLFACG